MLSRSAPDPFGARRDRSHVPGAPDWPGMGRPDAPARAAARRRRPSAPGTARASPGRGAPGRFAGGAPRFGSRGRRRRERKARRDGARQDRRRRDGGRCHGRGRDRRGRRSGCHRRWPERSRCRGRRRRRQRPGRRRRRYAGRGRGRPRSDARGASVGEAGAVAEGGAGFGTEERPLPPPSNTICTGAGGSHWVFSVARRAASSTATSSAACSSAERTTDTRNRQPRGGRGANGRSIRKPATAKPNRRERDASLSVASSAPVTGQGQPRAKRLTRACIPAVREPEPRRRTWGPHRRDLRRSPGGSRPAGRVRLSGGGTRRRRYSVASCPGSRSPATTARRRCRARARSRSPCHLARAAFAAQLPHRLDQQEQAVHAGMAVGQAAAVGVDRQAALRARCVRR